MVEHGKKEGKNENGELEYDAVIKIHGSIKWKVLKVLGFFSFAVSVVSVIVSVILKLLADGNP